MNSPLLSEKGRVAALNDRPERAHPVAEEVSKEQRSQEHNHRGDEVLLEPPGNQQVRDEHESVHPEIETDGDPFRQWIAGFRQENKEQDSAPDLDEPS